MNAMDMSRYLDEYAFPATREEIILMAEEHDAPDEVLAAISRLPEGVYDTLHEVVNLVHARSEEE